MSLCAFVLVACEFMPVSLLTPIATDLGVTAAPVGWWMWLARTFPHDAERGGGFMVAVVQLAIAAGATVGGILFVAQGYRVIFSVSAIVFVLASALAALAARSGRKS